MFPLLSQVDIVFCSAVCGKMEKSFFKAVVHNSDSCAGSKRSGCWGSAASGSRSDLDLATAGDGPVQRERDPRSS